MMANIVEFPNTMVVKASAPSIIRHYSEVKRVTAYEDVEVSIAREDGYPGVVHVLASGKEWIEEVITVLDTPLGMKLAETVAEAVEKALSFAWMYSDEGPAA